VKVTNTGEAFRMFLGTVEQGEIPCALPKREIISYLSGRIMVLFGKNLKLKLSIM
jgi:hypothetical protein